MKDNQKTKKQLIDELDMLRQKVATLEIAGSLRDASKAQQEDNAAKPKRKESRSFQEEKLNFVIEEAGLTSWEWDIEHDRKVFNAIWAEKLGYTLEEFNSALQEFSLDYFQHPEDLPAAQQAMKDCLTGKTSIYRAEYRMRTKTGDWKWMLALGKIIERNAGGKPTHMTGVNLDISERKRAEEALRESEARYRVLLEAIPDKIVHYRKDGTHLAVKMPLDYIATTQYDLDNRPNITQIDPELAPRVLSCLQQAVETRKTQVLEYELTRGDEREYREARYAAINQDEIVAIIRDITGRKRAEQALQQANERLQATLNALPDLMFEVDLEGRFYDYRDPHKDLLYVSPEVFLGKTVSQVLPKEAAEIINHAIAQAVEEGRHSGATYSLEMPAGLSWFELSIASKGDPKAPDGRLIVLAHDITERKLAAQALLESEGHYHLVTDNTADAIWLMDMNLKTTYTSPSAVRIRGYTLEELNAMTLDQHMTPASLNIVLQALGEELTPEKLVQPDLQISRTMELEYYRKDGSVFWSECTFTLVRDGAGNPIGILGVGRDITERKRVEDALRESERSYRTLVENIPGAVYRTEPNRPWRAIHISNEIEAISGYLARDFMDGPVRCYGDIELPEDTERSARIIETGIASKRPYIIESRIRHADGSIRWVYEQGRAVYSKQGEPLWLDGVIFDITERKQAEEALRQSEERYRLLAETSPEMIFVVNPESIVTYINNIGARSVGKQPLDIIGNRVEDFFPTETSTRQVNNLRKVFETGQPLYIESTNVFQGKTLWLDSWLVPIKDAGGSIVSVMGISRDITERKRAEEALRESEERYRSLFDRMLDGIYRSTHEGEFVDVNSAMVRMFGYSSKEEMLEVDIKNELYFAPEERGSHVLDTGQEEIEIYRMRRKDGSEIWVEDHGLYVHDEQGRIIYHEGMMRDVTERKRAEEALKKSEARFRSYFELPIVGITITAADKSWVDINDCLCDMLGYTREELLQKNWVVLTYPEDLNVDLGQFNRVLAGEIDGYSMDKRFIRKDGEIIWTSMSVRCIRLPDGSVDYFVDVVLDITERKRAEEALRESEERFRTLVENIPGEVYRCLPTPPWRLIHNSAKTETITGYLVSDFLKGSLLYSDFILPEDLEMVNSALEAGIACKVPYVIEYRLRQSDGSIHWVAERGRAVYSEQGEPLWLDGVIFDITERKRAEEAVRQSQERFRTLVENIPGAVYRCEPTPPWRTIHISSGIEVISGFPVRDFLEGIRYFERPEDLEMVNSALEAGIACKVPYVIEYRLRHANGSIRWVYEKGRAVYSEQGEPLCLDGVIFDITERKRAEEALREAQKLASMGTLAAGMAHEINSPLQVVTGLSERITRQLESGQLDEGKLKRDIATVNRCSWNIANIVRSLLTYARESTGQVASHNLNEIIKDALLLTEHQLKTWSNISVLSDLGRNLPPLSCERTQIVQVLINLLNNARDAMPNGGEITIRTRYNAEHNRFTLQVSDSGTGIPKEIQEKIFDPFFTTKEVGQGTGLGLSIVFGIVKAHGGDIKVESAPKQGSTFTIYLPKEPIQKPDSEPLAENQGRY